MTPTAYYDQNGAFILSNPTAAAGGRGLPGTPVRLVSPSPLIVGQQGNTTHKDPKTMALVAQFICIYFT